MIKLTICKILILLLHTFSAYAKVNYDVEILETLAKTVNVDANSIREAISIVKDGYRDELYILSADDYFSTDFIVLENEDI